MTQSPSSHSNTILHASCVAIEHKGILLLGKSGIGKSDLALRLIDRGALLVSDDQVMVVKKENQIMVSCPEQFADLIEVRGLGIMRLKRHENAQLTLAVQLVENHNEIERLPEVMFYECLGVNIPLLYLVPFDISSALKIEMAIAALGNSSMMMAGAFINS